MGLAIFDKSAPVFDGLELAFSRNYATKDGVFEDVASGEPRYDREGVVLPHLPEVQASSSRYWIQGGGDVFLYRDVNAAISRIAEGDGAGGITDLASITRTLVSGTAGSTTGNRGSTASINTQMGINATTIDSVTGTGLVFSNTPASGNHICHPPNSASCCNGILRIHCTYSRHNGTLWLYAGCMVFYSLNKGSTWSVEYATNNSEIGVNRGRDWSLQSTPTPIYARAGGTAGAQTLAWADADYQDKGDNPSAGSVVVSIWSNAISGAWQHIGAVEILTPGNTATVDHVHQGVVLECVHADGRKGLQLVIAEGDGTDTNQVTRWTFFQTAIDVDPAVVNSLSGFTTPTNWVFDTSWNEGIGKTGAPRGTFTNQFVPALATDVEGEFIAGSDIGNIPFMLFRPGGSAATEAEVDHVKYDWACDEAICLYMGSDGNGRMVARVYDDRSNVADSLSGFESRIVYSDDYGKSWCSLAVMGSTDNQPVISNGFVYYNDGQSGTDEGRDGIYSRPLPTSKIRTRPIMVSPGGANFFYRHGSGDSETGAQPNINWFNRSTLGNWLDGTHPDSTTPGDSSLIQRTSGGANDGKFIDPDTGAEIPEPPVVTDFMLKVVCPEGITQGGDYICKPWFGRRFAGGAGDPTYPSEQQTDVRGWVLRASDSRSGLGLEAIQCFHYSTLGDFFNGASNADDFRAEYKYRDRNVWAPMYTAGNHPQAAGGGRLSIGVRDRENLTVGQSFYFVPDFAVLGGGGKINIALPYSAGSDQTYADESLRLTGIGFLDGAERVRVISRVPWSSWGGFSDEGTIAGAKTIWRLYANATNWIVAEWNATLGGVRIRVNDGGTTKQLDLGANIRAQREMVVDLAIARDGSNLTAAVSIDGKRYSGTLTGGLGSISSLDAWKAGADESDDITAWNTIAVETDATGANAATLETLLESMPALPTTGGLRGRPSLGGALRTRERIGGV